MAEINLRDIFRAAFGYDAPEKKVVIPPASPRVEKSISTGQPYYDEDVFGREFFLPVRLDGQLLPFAVMSMNWRKTIVSTPMPERGGSVHELISIDDYTFNVKGILINPGNDFPEAWIIDIKRLWLKNQSVTLRSVKSDLVLSGRSNTTGDDPYGHRVIVKEIKWPAVSGVEHALPFEIDLVSDLIFDLEIK
jgi:hypothetical protein